MSGAFGWNKSSGGSSGSGGGARNSSYDDAYDGYQSNTPRVKKVNPSSTSKGDNRLGKDRDRASFKANRSFVIPDGLHKLKATAKHVVIVAVDTTGSMGEWTEQLFERLPLLKAELVEILGSDDIEILVCAFGDAKYDRYPIQVPTAFGRDAELDEYVASLKDEGGGAGDGAESPELLAYYLATKIDYGEAQTVSTFFVTDEPGANRVDANLVERYLNETLQPEVADTRVLFQLLRRRMRVNTLLMNRGCYEYQPIEDWWNTVLPEGVIPLDIPHRVVDAISLAIANSISAEAEEAFMTRFTERQKGKRHQAQNVSVIQQTQLRLQSRASMPKLPPGSGGQTRSPLDP